MLEEIKVPTLLQVLQVAHKHMPELRIKKTGKLTVAILYDGEQVVCEDENGDETLYDPSELELWESQSYDY